MNNFIKTLFQGVPENLYVNIWTLPDKVSYWIKPDDDLPDLTDKDVYFGVGLSAQDYGSHRRLKENQVVGITCVWADVDFGEGHKKKVPPDEATAGELLRQCGIHPSIVIHSGGGFHPYWIFDKPWIFQSDAEREAGALFVKQWQEYLRSQFTTAGYTLDATHDLPRVLRVPGYNNLKIPDKPRPVGVFWPAYNVVDKSQLHCHERAHFFQYMKKPAPTKQQKAEKLTGSLFDSEDINLDPDAEAPSAKLAAMLINSPEFRRTWDCNRNDFTDQSASAYDMAIVNYCVLGEWTVQEIVNTVIHFRRESGFDVTKALRWDYHKNTIEKAIQGMKSGGPLPKSKGKGKSKDQPVTPSTTQTATHVEDDGFETSLEDVSQKIGFPVKKVLRQGKEDVLYSIVLPDDTEIFLGSAQTLFNQNHVRVKLFNAVGKPIRIFKAVGWHDLCRRLFVVAEYVPDEEATQTVVTREWLRQHVDPEEVYEGDNWITNLLNNRPFCKNGMVHISGSGFLKHVKGTLEQKHIMMTDIRRVLRVMGFVNQPVSGRDHKNVTRTRRYWIIPAETYKEICNTEKPLELESKDEDGV